MNERQLNSFISTIDLGSFSKAAKLQKISVPALIQQIDLLEESLGFKVVRRTTHGVKLTEEGADFYNDAVEIMRIFNAAKEKHAKKREVIYLGLEENQVPDFLEDAVNSFFRKHNNVDLEIIEAPYDHLVELVNKGEIDCTVIAEPKDELKKGSFTPLFEDTYSFVVSVEHSFAYRLFVDNRDLRKREVLYHTTDSMKKNYAEGLADTEAITEEVETLSELDNRKMFVIHASYEKSYSDEYAVVGSTLPAGSVGVFAKSEATDIDNEFIQYLKERI